MRWDGFLKIGHRGAAGYEIENTMESFQRALDLGANAVELDARMTKDGELVVFHDPSLSRLVNRPDRVSDLDYSEIQNIVIQNCCPESVRNIPKLSQVLETFGGRILINIELKERGIGGAVAALVSRLGFADSVLLSAFARDENDSGDSSEWQDLFWAKAVNKNLRIALAAKSPEWANHAILAARSNGTIARDAPFPIYALCVGSYTINEELVRRVRSETDCRMMVWTVNDSEEIKKFKEMGVDGIFSDYPDRL